MTYIEKSCAKRIIEFDKRRLEWNDSFEELLAWV